MSQATDKISMRAMDCRDHVECWQEYHEEGLVMRLILDEQDVKDSISILNTVLCQMQEIRKEKGYE